MILYVIPYKSTHVWSGINDLKGVPVCLAGYGEAGSRIVVKSKKKDIAQQFIGTCIDVAVRENQGIGPGIGIVAC